MKAFLKALLAAVVVSMAGCTGKTKFQSENQAAIPDAVYLDAGNRITVATFDTLRNTLLAAVRDGGFDSAVSFCNLNANPLTRTYADSVAIGRTSARYRNSNNAPTNLEQAILDEFQASFAIGKPLNPRIVRSDSTAEIHFFKPIMTQAFCLNCHGEPGKDISTETLARIGRLYPKDQAVHYKEGELRGAWHLVFSGPTR